MKCPNCGAENEAGARFCVECGVPLESPVDLPPAPPEFDEADTDRTILSNASWMAEEAKTVAVTQDQLAAAEAEAVSSSRVSSFDSTPSSPLGGSGSSGAGFWTQRNIIIIAVVAVVLLLCCCCCSLLIGVISADPDMFDDFSLRLLPAYLPYV